MPDVERDSRAVFVVGLAALLVIAVIVVTHPWTLSFGAGNSKPGGRFAGHATPSPEAAISPPTTSAKLKHDLQKYMATVGAAVEFSLLELGGPNPRSLSIDADTSVTAGSTYKVALLMQQADGIAAGKYKSADKVCFKPADLEKGGFTDYTAGKCFSRLQLGQRVGIYNDNTAARMLIRDIGGAGALNSYARAHGASKSAFFYPNTTTPSELTQLWADENEGKAGGGVAQRWLYPLLTNTKLPDGIPKGTPPGFTVLHKSGSPGNATVDTALVLTGKNGPYVLTVAVAKKDTEAWPVIEKVAAMVAAYEDGR